MAATFFRFKNLVIFINYISAQWWVFSKKVNCSGKYYYNLLLITVLFLYFINFSTILSLSVLCFDFLFVFHLIEVKNKKHQIRREACAFAQRAALAIQQTNKSTPLYRGVCPIQATGIIIGQDCTVVWNGKGSLEPPWPIRNQWENKDEVFYFLNYYLITQTWRKLLRTLFHFVKLINYLRKRVLQSFFYFW